MYYKNDDYTVRIEIVDGCEKYFIKFHGQIDEPEFEIEPDIFKMYIKEFNKPLERQRNEKRRHIEDGSIEEFINSGKLTLDSDIYETRYAIETAIKICTPIQQRRLTLHYIHGYSFTEIAKMEKCKEASVRESITAALKKIKNYF